MKSAAVRSNPSNEGVDEADRVVLTNVFVPAIPATTGWTGDVRHQCDSDAYIMIGGPTLRKRCHSCCIENAAAILGQKSRGFERYQNARVGVPPKRPDLPAGQEKPRRGEGHQHNPLIRHRRPRTSSALEGRVMPQPARSAPGRGRHRPRQFRRAARWRGRDGAWLAHLMSPDRPLKGKALTFKRLPEIRVWQKMPHANLHRKTGSFPFLQPEPVQGLRRIREASDQRHGRAETAEQYDGENDQRMGGSFWLISSDCRAGWRRRDRSARGPQRHRPRRDRCRATARMRRRLRGFLLPLRTKSIIAAL